MILQPQTQGSQRSIQHSWLCMGSDKSAAEKIPYGVVKDISILTSGNHTIKLGSIAGDCNTVNMILIAEDRSIATVTVSEWGKPVPISGGSIIGGLVLLSQPTKAFSASFDYSSAPSISPMLVTSCSTNATGISRLDILDNGTSTITYSLTSAKRLTTDDNLRIYKVDGGHVISLTADGKSQLQVNYDVSGITERPITTINNVIPNAAGELAITISVQCADEDDCSDVEIEYDPTTAAVELTVPNIATLKPVNIIKDVLDASKSATDGYRPVLDCVYTPTGEYAPENLSRDWSIDPDYDRVE